MEEWIDGAARAPQIQQEAAVEVARIKERVVKPGLAVFMGGGDQASHVYVRGKVRMSEALGMHSEKIDLPVMVFPKASYSEPV